MITVDVEPDLAIKIRSVVEKELHSWTKDKEAVGLDIAASAFSRTRSWLIASFTIVGLAFAVFGWSFHSFVENQKEKVKEHQLEIKKDKEAIHKEKEKILQDIKLLKGKLQDSNINILLQQVEDLRQKIALTTKKVDKVEGRAVSLESVLIGSALESKEPLSRQKRDEIQAGMNGYNGYLHSLGLSSIQHIQVKIDSAPAGQVSGRLIRFAQIEKDRKTVKVAQIAAEVSDPVFNDFTRCILLQMITPQEELAERTRTASLRDHHEELYIIAGLAYYYTCSYKDSPVFQWGVNTTLAINTLPSGTNGSPAGAISSFDRVWSAFFWKIREATDKKYADGLLAGTWKRLSRERNGKLSNTLFVKELRQTAASYGQGQHRDIVDRLVDEMTTTIPAME